MRKKRRVYLAECAGKYKIGVSCDVARRIAELDKRPFPTRLIARSDLVFCAFEAEREIHEWLFEYRIDGEWFSIPDDFLYAVVDAVVRVDDSAFGYEGGQS